MSNQFIMIARDQPFVIPIQVKTLPDELGHVEHLAADNGYFSATNIEACEQESIIPLLACGREAHHSNPEDRLQVPVRSLQ